MYLRRNGNVEKKKKNIRRKVIHFDLDTNALKEHYDKDRPKDERRDWHNAYYDIRSFLETNGFVHRQGSGYESADVLTLYECVDLIIDMCKTFRWLKSCVNKLDVSEISEEFYDLTNYVNEFFATADSNNDIYIHDGLKDIISDIDNIISLSENIDGVVAKDDKEIEF